MRTKRIIKDEIDALRDEIKTDRNRLMILEAELMMAESDTMRQYGVSTKIRHQLKYHRVKLKITQTTLAKMIGLSRTQVTNVERGIGSTSLERLETWCKALE